MEVYRQAGLETPIWDAAYGGAGFRWTPVQAYNLNDDDYVSPDEPQEDAGSAASPCGFGPIDQDRLEVCNASGNPHNFHVHGVQFKLATHAASAPPPYLAGWKDTAYIPPGATTDLVLRFTRHTDPTIPYMFHCHRMRHEDNRMMGQFVIVNPGQQASKPLSHHHRDSAEQRPISEPIINKGVAS